MDNLLLDYCIIDVVFILWILLDSWAVKWREAFWEFGGYKPKLSQEYVKCLLTVFSLLMVFLVVLTGRWWLIVPFVFRQQCGFEDLGYWLVGTGIFGKDWSFTETGKFLGMPYPRWWPWLNTMPVLRFISGGTVSFGGLLRAVIICEVLVFVWLVWINHII
jgi:hypothetical protein